MVAQARAGDKALSLSWSGAPAANLRGYQVLWRRHGTTAWASVVLPKAAASYVISSLTDGVVYDWQVVPLYGTATVASGSTAPVASGPTFPGVNVFPSPALWP